ncbi:uncharacterized protein LOC131230554 [Magnolia sinica]|uniref:uncharacterized protein LOC131230554 n=1 Tax=Magnolia sinica TaxID=86752 RepID=UPI0026582B64|nr:uncharacterized protein LOC131230554 [Magnolia sinica]
MDSWLIWNARGVGNSPTISSLKRLIIQSRPSLVAILEPMLRDEKRVGTGLKLGFHQSISNAHEGGKIWIFHNSPLSIDHVSTSNQLLSLLIKVQGCLEVLLASFVYAKCSKILRRSMWDQLLVLTNGFSIPWLVARDFNAVLYPSERRGPGSFDTQSAAEFNEGINRAGLKDAGFTGNIYTWCNNQQGLSRAWARLDRACSNDDWMRSFPSFQVSLLPRIHFDHGPLLISFPHQPRNSPKQFRFQRMWCLHDSFQEVVKQTWASNLTGDLMLAESNVVAAELAMQTKNNEASIQVLQQAKEKLTHMELCEEIFWKQKSRNHQLKEGDRNSKFFHSSASYCARRSQISTIQLEDGTVLSDNVSIKNAAFSFFSSLMEATPSTPASDILDAIPPTISADDNRGLLLDLTIEEVHAAFMAIPADSAPGPDGFLGAFLHHCWDVVGQDILAAVCSFFHGSPLPRTFLASFLCLIPKSSAPVKFFDFRPISLYWDLYSHKLFLLNREFLSKADPLRKITLWQKRSLEILTKRSEAIQLVEKCWNNSWFSILINGEPTGFFKSAQGLHQGDPLFPTLFIITAEVLSRGFRRLIDSGSCSPFQTRGDCPVILHLLYADDMFLLANGFSRCLRKISKFLALYQSTSG